MRAQLPTTSVLLWPLPMILVAVVVAESAQSWGKLGQALVAFHHCLSGRLKPAGYEQYLYQMARNGSTGSWTDAIPHSPEA